MKKFLITLFLLIFCIFPAYSLTVDEAREFAFSHIEDPLYISLFSDFSYDMFSRIHVEDAKRGYVNFSDVTAYGEMQGNIRLVFWYDEVDYYILSYEKFPCFEFVYNLNGRLRYIIFENVYDLKYPRKSIKYGTDGKVVRVQVTMPNGEKFIFRNNKKLLTHWVDKKPYNEKGKRLRFLIYEL